MIKTQFIKMNGIQDVMAFVKIASSIDRDVLVKKGKYCIDGKSLMGILSLSLTSVMNLKIISNNKENEDEFIEKISNVIVTEDKGN